MLRRDELPPFPGVGGGVPCPPGAGGGVLLGGKPGHIIGEEGQKADFVDPGYQLGGGANAQRVVPIQPFHDPVRHYAPPA